MCTYVNLWYNKQCLSPATNNTKRCELHKCHIDKCIQPHITNSVACFHHKCKYQNYECISPTVYNTNSCELHKCSFDKCKQPYTRDSAVCDQHTCKKENCRKADLKLGYCVDHTCEFDGCFNMRKYFDHKFCIKHLCVKCKAFSLNHVPCKLHKCQMNGCNKPNEGNITYHLGPFRNNGRIYPLNIHLSCYCTVHKDKKVNGK